MTLSTPFLLEVWSVFHAFRSLGFPPDVLFFATDDTGYVGVELQWNGEKIGIRVGSVPGGTHATISAQWKEFLEQLPTIEDDVLDRAWASSRIRPRMPMIIAGLVARGVTPPVPTDMLN
jgi:hypothetical protein